VVRNFIEFQSQLLYIINLPYLEIKCYAFRVAGYKLKTGIC
jgi:hypothetical protein